MAFWEGGGGAVRDRRCQVVNAGTYHLSQTLGDKPGRLLSVGGKNSS